MNTLNSLLVRALIVMNETLTEMNTAVRIGSLFRDILYFLYNLMSNAILGIILKGEKVNEVAIKAIPDPERGDTWKANDTGHYWTYDGSQWNDIGEIIPSNIVTKEEFENRLKDKANVTDLPSKPVSDIYNNNIDYTTEYIAAFGEYFIGSRSASEIKNSGILKQVNIKCAGTPAIQLFAFSIVDNIATEIHYYGMYNVTDSINNIEINDPFILPENSFIGIDAMGGTIYTSPAGDGIKLSKHDNVYSVTQAAVKYSFGFDVEYKIPSLKENIYNINAVLDNYEEISPIEKAIEHTYQNKYIDTAGNLNTYNGYWVRVYKVNEGDKIQVRGTSSSTGKFYVLLSGYTADNYTKVANGTASASGQQIDEMVVIPEGVNYIAVTRDAKAYDIIIKSETIERLEDAVAEIPKKADSGGSDKTLQEVDSIVQGVAQNLDFEYVDIISPTEKTVEYTYQDKYINTAGNLNTYNGYWVRVYKVNKGDRVQIKGTASSTGKFYVLLSGYTADNYTKVADGTASTGGKQIDEMVVIPEGVNYIAVTRDAKAYDVNIGTHSKVDDLEDAVYILSDKIVNCYGDSLTAGSGGNGVSYPDVLQKLLGEEWTVKNKGAGGENTTTIGARQGGMPMYIKNPVTIPADGSLADIPIEVIEGVTNYGLYSSYNDAQVRPLLQGSASLLNPCVIEGIVCSIWWFAANNNYRINRNIPGNRDISTPPNCLITPVDVTNNNRKGINILFMGQNGGYDTGAELTAQFEQLTDFKGDGKYMCITSHGNGYPNIVSVVKKRFGVRHIGLKEYYATKAIYDAIDLGLLDSSAYPTQADLDAMNAGNCPPSLLSDAIHFNKTGYIVLGVVAYNKMVALGYVDNPKTLDEIKGIVSGL